MVGDVHGCLFELDQLLAKVNFRSEDMLILVGDLVAKGPDSRGVLRRCRELGAEFVRGNHDEHCLRFRRASLKNEPLPTLRLHHQKVVQELGEEDWNYLQSAPLYVRLVDLLPEQDVLIVHAGFDPSCSLKNQIPAQMMNMRSILPGGRVTKKLIEDAPWAAAWPGPELVLFGHDALRGLQRYPLAIGLDTGCVYGGKLTAAVFENATLRIESVPASKVWCPPQGNSAHIRMRVCKRSELVHGMVKTVPLPKGNRRRPRQAIILLDNQGCVRGYENLCKHLPIPLSTHEETFFDDDSLHLFCRTHGAKYRLHDGLCIEGPCQGESLNAMHVFVEDDEVWIKIDRDKNSENS